MKLSEIRSTLREIRVTPVKTLGQNFLHDQNLCRWIVEQAEIAPDDYVVEIGPGLGALTEFILAKGAHVLAIEKDGRLAEFLRERFASERLEVLHANALDFDARILFTRPKVKLIGNLPYNVASQLLIKYLEYPSPISLWLFMLQREMADRLTAIPSTKDYGALTLQIQFHYSVKRLRNIPANVFFPAPEVDSAIVRLYSRDESSKPVCDFVTFVDLARRGFSQRRKQLRNLVSELVPGWDRAAAAIGLDPRARAETVSLEQWAALANYVRPVLVSSKDRVDLEKFPVVDDADRVLGAASRAEVHANNLRHRAIHILLLRRNGDVFLQKRSRWKDRHPLLWDSSVAGHVDAGEEYDEAASRELREELGIETRLERVGKLPASDKTGQEFIWVYRGSYDGAFSLDCREIDSGAYFSQEVVSAWRKARPNDFAPAFAECWRLFCDAAPPA